MNDGIATAARMPMMATTIISSMSVKPLARRQETFFIKISYSKLLIRSMNHDRERAGDVGGGHPQTPVAVGEREDFDALGLFVIEELRGHTALLLAAQRLPARVDDARRQR